MTRALKPKKVLKTLAKSLKITPEALALTLFDLPNLLSESRVEELIACAAKGAEGDDSLLTTEAYAAMAGDGEMPDAGWEVTPAGVATLLRSELESRLKDVRPAFVAAAVALREALQLDPSST